MTYSAVSQRRPPLRRHDRASRNWSRILKHRDFPNDQDTHTAALKGGAVLWVTWGFVHALAGAMTLISAAAIVLSFGVWLSDRKTATAHT